MILQMSTLNFKQTYNITGDFLAFETPFSHRVIFAQAHLFRSLRKNDGFLEVFILLCL